jgi:hypothetical protein
MSQAIGIAEFWQKAGTNSMWTYTRRACVVVLALRNPLTREIP